MRASSCLQPIDFLHTHATRSSYILHLVHSSRAASLVQRMGRIAALAHAQVPRGHFLPKTINNANLSSSIIFFLLVVVPNVCF